MNGLEARGGAWVLRGRRQGATVSERLASAARFLLTRAWCTQGARGVHAIRSTHGVRMAAA